MVARLSAWMAVLTAAAIAFAVVTGGAIDASSAGPLVTAVLLGVGAYRTLTGQSGGLRLLCGAWGLAGGMAWYAPSYNTPAFVPGMVAIGAPVLVCMVGLALTVMHKERK